jgi:hypothetical protein
MTLSLDRGRRWIDVFSDGAGGDLLGRPADKALKLFPLQGGPGSRHRPEIRGADEGGPVDCSGRGVMPYSGGKRFSKYISWNMENLRA